MSLSAQRDFQAHIMLAVTSDPHSLAPRRQPLAPTLFAHPKQQRQHLTDGHPQKNHATEPLKNPQRCPQARGHRVGLSLVGDGEHPHQTPPALPSPQASIAPSSSPSPHNGGHRSPGKASTLPSRRTRPVSQGNHPEIIAQGSLGNEGSSHPPGRAVSPDTSAAHYTQM